jgi:hypothetical protein
MEGNGRAESPAADHEPPGRGPFLERPIALVTLVGGILGIAVALVTLTGMTGGADQDDDEQDKVAARSTALYSSWRTPTGRPSHPHRLCRARHLCLASYSP